MKLTKEEEKYFEESAKMIEEGRIDEMGFGKVHFGPPPPFLEEFHLKIMNAITKRHTVRKFLDKPLQESDIKLIEARINALNKQYGLSLKLVVNDKGGIATG